MLLDMLSLLVILHGPVLFSLSGGQPFLLCLYGLPVQHVLRFLLPPCIFLCCLFGFMLRVGNFEGCYNSVVILYSFCLSVCVSFMGAICTLFLAS